MVDMLIGMPVTDMPSSMLGDFHASDISLAGFGNPFGRSTSLNTLHHRVIDTLSSPLRRLSPLSSGLFEFLEFRKAMQELLGPELLD